MFTVFYGREYLEYKITPLPYLSFISPTLSVMLKFIPVVFQSNSSSKLTLLFLTKSLDFPPLMVCRTYHSRFRDFVSIRHSLSFLKSCRVSLTPPHHSFSSLSTVPVLAHFGAFLSFLKPNEDLIRVLLSVNNPRESDLRENIIYG